MMSHFTFGPTAHRNLNPNNKEIAMRNILTIVMVVLVAAIFTPACSDQPDGVSASVQTLSTEVRWPASCTDENVADENKPASCAEDLTVEACYQRGDIDEGTGDGVKDLHCETQTLSRDSGLTATAEFAPPPVSPKQYIAAFMTYSGITLGDDDVMETCDTGAKLPDTLTLLPGKETPRSLCIRIVNHDDGDVVVGSGTGDLCVEVTDDEGNPVDESTCDFAVDGKPVTPDADDSGSCPDGALLSGLAAKTSSLEVTCDEQDGSLTTEVAEDMVTNVTVEVSEEPVVMPGDSGNVCLTVNDDQQMGVDGCTTNFTTLAGNDEPMVSSSPPMSCNGTGQYYFENVPADTHGISVSCPGDLNGQNNINVEADKENAVDITLSAPVPDGALCVTKLGLPIDLDTPTADMGVYLGYGSGGDCVAATQQQLSSMSVTGFSGDNCVDENDSNCAIQVQGLIASMVNGFNGYAANEQRIFAVDVTDGNGNVTVYIDTLNGYFQP